MWYEQEAYFGERLLGVSMGNFSIHVELRPIHIQQKNTWHRNTHSFNLFFWIGIELSIPSPVFKIYYLKKSHVCPNVYNYSLPIFLPIVECFKQVIDTYGALHIVCNNAGIANEIEWEKTLQVNLVRMLVCYFVFLFLFFVLRINYKSTFFPKS